MCESVDVMTRANEDVRKFRRRTPAVAAKSLLAHLLASSLPHFEAVSHV
jgi:hypothetical protein